MNNHNQAWVIYRRQLMTIFLRNNYIIIALYILERLSSWRTSRRHPSWPRPRVRLNLLLALFHKYLTCLSWPTQYLAVCSNDSYFTPTPSLATTSNTSAQVNNMAMPHDIYTLAHSYIIYITIRFFLHTSSTPLGRPAGPDPSCLAQLLSVFTEYMDLCQKKNYF